MGNDTNLNGGAYGLRGYLLQTLVCLFETFDNDWISFSLEPNINANKVDIIWTYENKGVKVVQVKSSKNNIGLDQIKTWANELKKDITANEYELYLIGSFSQKTLQHSKLSGVSIKHSNFLNPLEFIKIASHDLNISLTKQSNKSYNPEIIQVLIETLVTKLQNSAIGGKVYTKEQFLKIINDLIEIIKNDDLITDDIIFPTLNLEASSNPGLKILANEEEIKTFLCLSKFEFSQGSKPFCKFNIKISEDNIKEFPEILRMKPTLDYLKKKNEALELSLKVMFSNDLYLSNNQLLYDTFINLTSIKPRSNEMFIDFSGKKKIDFYKKSNNHTWSFPLYLEDKIFNTLIDKIENKETLNIPYYNDFIDLNLTDEFLSKILFREFISILGGSLSRNEITESDIDYWIKLSGYYLSYG